MNRPEVWCCSSPVGKGGAFLVWKDRPLPLPPFESAADAEAFVTWCHGDSFAGGWLNLEGLERLVGLWPHVRHLDKCPNHDDPKYPCHNRRPPDGTHCNDCHADEEFANNIKEHPTP